MAGCITAFFITVYLIDFFPTILFISRYIKNDCEVEGIKDKEGNSHLRRGYYVPGKDCAGHLCMCYNSSWILTETGTQTKRPCATKYLSSTYPRASESFKWSHSWLAVLSWFECNFHKTHASYTIQSFSVMEQLLYGKALCKWFFMNLPHIMGRDFIQPFHRQHNQHLVHVHIYKSGDFTLKSLKHTHSSTHTYTHIR